LATFSTRSPYCSRSARDPEISGTLTAANVAIDCGSARPIVSTMKLTVMPCSRNAMLCLKSRSLVTGAARKKRIGDVRISAYRRA
jgi:hypothetical protein